MPELEWGRIEDRRYEAGIDQGVFYPITGPGVSWNGIQSVTEDVVGAELQDYHVDGIKFLSTIGGEDYQSTVRAFSAPREFSSHDGQPSLFPGVVLTRQPRRRFNFSYRSGVGLDEYKLHLVYNILAAPTATTHTTKSDQVTPQIKEWKFSATPVPMVGMRPTAHVIISSDQTDFEKLSELEDILYGTESTTARFPTFSELLDIFS